MKRALIIGGGGFVGGHLAAHLRALGWQAELTASTPRPGMHTLDVTREGEVRALLEQLAPDCLFHLAAQSSAARSWKEPALTVEVNVRGAVNVLEAARALPRPPRVLLVGSSEEYGAAEASACPLTETQPARPGNIYAATKLCQETIGLLYARGYGLEVMATRSFNHIGPGQGAGFVVADFCRQTALIERGRQEPVIRVGNLQARRDFTDVRDVVRAYALLMEQGESGQVYNVGSGRARPVEEILNAVLRLATVPIGVARDETLFRPLDVPLQVADITKLRRATGWSPQVPLEQTLRETLDYWRTII